MNYENTIIEKLFILLCLIIVVCGIVLGNKTSQYEYWVSVFEQNVWIKSWQETISWTKVSNTKPWSTMNKQAIRDIKLNNSSEVQSIQLMSGKIIHKWFASDDYRQKLINYAYKKWWMDLLILMECESWMNPLNIWDDWDAYGLCQMNKRYHDIPKEYYQDRKFQVDYCYDKRKGWTRFYWPDRPLYKNKVFIGICKDVVKSRFTIKNK